MGEMLFFQSQVVDKLSYEDNRRAATFDVTGYDATKGTLGAEEDDDGIWVQIVSWSEVKDHTVLESALGKRILVTIQILKDATDKEEET